jgi:hypothetical protein
MRVFVSQSDSCFYVEVEREVKLPLIATLNEVWRDLVFLFPLLTP